MAPQATRMVGAIKRCSGLALVGLLLLSCETGESNRSPTVRTATGTLTHAGIMDEVTIGGSVTVSGSIGTD